MQLISDVDRPKSRAQLFRLTHAQDKIEFTWACSEERAQVTRVGRV
jgi:hypothetical protein